VGETAQVGGITQVGETTRVGETAQMGVPWVEGWSREVDPGFFISLDKREKYTEN